jgi:hypothetical protein
MGFLLFRLPPGIHPQVPATICRANHHRPLNLIFLLLVRSELHSQALTPPADTLFCVASTANRTTTTIVTIHGRLPSISTPLASAGHLLLSSQVTPQTSPSLPCSRVTIINQTPSPWHILFGFSGYSDQPSHERHLRRQPQDTTSISTYRRVTSSGHHPLSRIHPNLLLPAEFMSSSSPVDRMRQRVRMKPGGCVHRAAAAGWVIFSSQSQIQQQR